MLLWRYPGAAGGVHRDLYLGHERLQKQGIRHHANICAQADELDLDFLALRKRLEVLRKVGAAKGGLLVLLCALEQLGYIPAELPTVRALYAVLNVATTSSGA